jgi:hypothetical protein
MTFLDFLNQHTGLLYWTIILTFVYGVGREFIKFGLRNIQKFPDPGKDNTYITNNYWPGGPQEFVTGEVEEGVEAIPGVEVPQNKDLL